MKKWFCAKIAFSFAAISLNLLSHENMALAKKWKKMDGNLYYINGNVGIGTTTPEAPLSISSDKAPHIGFDGTADDFVTLDFNRHGEHRNSVGIAPETGTSDIPANAFVIGSYDGEDWSDPLIIENAAPTGSIFINSSGLIGIGTFDPLESLDVIGNITASGSITEGSSRDLKTDIANVSVEEAMETLKRLNPVKFKYKADYSKEEHLGFIAEEVPDLVAFQDRKRMSPMDIAAVITKVVQEQQEEVMEQRRIIQEQQKIISLLIDKVRNIEDKM